MKMFRSLPVRIGKKHFFGSEKVFRKALSLKAGDLVFGYFSNHVVKAIEVSWKNFRSGMIMDDVFVLCEDGYVFYASEGDIFEGILRDEFFKNLQLWASTPDCRSWLEEWGYEWVLKASLNPDVYFEANGCRKMKDGQVVE